MQEFLEIRFLNNSVKDYLFFIASLALGILVLYIIKKIVLKHLLAKAQKTETNVDETIIRGINKYLLPILYFGVLFLSINFIHVDETVLKILGIVFAALILFLGAKLISTVLIFIFNRYWRKKKDDADLMAVKWIGVIIKVAVWTIALMLFLENIGVEVTALVAGLGIGGIAIAFAAQAVLADIFSFVTIFFDRPFEIGDFIIIDDLMGTVEHIGIKTTRIRSLSGEQLVFSNRDLTDSRLRNFKRMQNRRVVFRIGVTYNTQLQKLKEIPGIIGGIIESIEDVTFDRAHFFEFADFSLNFEIVYHVLSQDYAVYMDIQQKINLRIKEEFDARHIEFAFPTQTLHVHDAAQKEARSRRFDSTIQP